MNRQAVSTIGALIPVFLLIIALFLVGNVLADNLGDSSISNTEKIPEPNELAIIIPETDKEPVKEDTQDSEILEDEVEPTIVAENIQNTVEMTEIQNTEQNTDEKESEKPAITVVELVEGENNEKPAVSTSGGSSKSKRDSQDDATALNVQETIDRFEFTGSVTLYIQTESNEWEIEEEYSYLVGEGIEEDGGLSPIVRIFRPLNGGNYNNDVEFIYLANDASQTIGQYCFLSTDRGRTIVASLEVPKITPTTYAGKTEVNFAEEGDYEVSVVCFNKNGMGSDTVNFSIVSNGDSNEELGQQIPLVEIVSPTKGEIYIADEQDGLFKTIGFSFKVHNADSSTQCSLDTGSSELNLKLLPNFSPTLTAGSILVIYPIGEHTSAISCTNSQGTGISQVSFSVIKEAIEDSPSQDETTLKNSELLGCRTQRQCSCVDGVYECSKIYDQCYSPAHELEGQSCNEGNTDNTADLALEVEKGNQNILSILTGAIIGPNGQPKILGLVVFLALLIAVYVLVISFRKH